MEPGVASLQVLDIYCGFNSLPKDTTGGRKIVCLVLP